jgi:fatty acid-binding protein DegV
VLQVKPILTGRDGRVEFFEQQRTKTRALARIRELVVSACPRSRESFLCVMHAGAREEAEDLAAGLRDALGLADIPIYELPPAIVVHGGPGILATSYFSASLRQERPVLAR